MSSQQMMPREQNPKNKRTMWIRLKSIITILAVLWHSIAWIWSILILGIIVGVLGNTVFTSLTTGKMDFTGTLTIVEWLNTHLTLCITILFPILVITFCSYLAHHWQQRMAKENQQIHDESLVVVAKGVRRALDELNAKPTASPIISSSFNQETTFQSTAWNIPYRRNPFFTGREKLLRLLHDNLTINKAATLTQAQAISGLGGIGKTQTAIEYAYRYRDEYSFILWASAASRDTLMLDFVALASLLDLPEKQAQDQNITVAAFKRWLATHDKWLLILDNADDLEVANDFLPVSAKGHILITTRAQAAGMIANCIEVQEMDKHEGMLLLLRRARVLAPDAPLDQAPENDQAKAEAIVAAMDGLPLALDQAGAYIEETGCTITSYLEQYQRRQIDLLKRRGGPGTDHHEPVATTWSLSFERVENLNPTAADLLRFCAFLSPDAIPIEMIVAGATHLGLNLQPIANDPSLLDEPIAILRRYSLVRRNKEDNALSIHRLLQFMIKAGMSKEIQHQWSERTVQAINKAFPIVKVETWPQCKRYLPHAKACADLIDQYILAFPEAARLLNQAAYYLNVHAFYEEAEPLHQRALAIRKQTFGPMHPDTASSIHNLALLYNNQGKYEQAESLFRQALAIRELTLDPGHPDTAQNLNNLASLYERQGKYEQAEPLYRQALAIRERVLGPEHPATAGSLNGLGWLYHKQGKYEQAEPLYQRALAIRELTLDPGHPDTAQNLNNLASLYERQGKYEQAEPLYRQALAIRERVLRPEHPITAHSLHGLALLYYAQGKYEQAEPLFQQALAIRERVLGSGNPETARSFIGLALLYEKQGKYELVELLLQKALAIFNRLPGPEHPDVSTVINALASLYKIQGKYEQAESLYRRALAIRERVFGPEHPATATNLNQLADLFNDQGKYDQTEILYQKALAINEQALGLEHPNLAYSLHGLAMLYERQDKYKQAEPLYQRALAIREKILGANHPDTITIRANYMTLLNKMKRKKK